MADTPLCRFDQRLIEEQFPFCDPSSAQVILDLGSGTGRTTVQLAQRGYHVVAVDLSQSMLEQLRLKVERIDSTVAGRVQCVRANLVELGALANETADHAVCLFSTLGMIQGSAHRMAALSHAARIVRPGGSLFVHVHHRWSMLGEPRGLRRLGTSWVRSRFDSKHEFGDSNYAYRGLESMFLHRFSRRQLVDELKAGGWTVDRMMLVSQDGATEVKHLRRAGGFIAVCRNVASG